MYYENVSYDDGDTEPDENGRVLLGSYELTDVHVGQTLNAWNYVVDIPGHFFWDGWPQNLTLTGNLPTTSPTSSTSSCGTTSTL